MIDFDVSDVQVDLERLAVEFARRELAPAARRAEREGRVPAGLAESLASLQLHLVSLPEAMGGAGQSLYTATLVERALAQGDLGLVVALGAWADAVLAVAALAGADPARGAQLIAGTPPSLCLRAARVRLTHRPEGVQLDGLVPLVPGAGRRPVLTWARGEEAQWLVRIDPGVPGLEVVPRRGLMGLGAGSAADIVLAAVPLAPERAWPGTPGGLTLAAAVQWLVGAARLVGVGRHALAEAVAYAGQRRAFGQVIARHQAVAFLLADMALALEEAWALVWRACERGSAGPGFVRLAHDAWVAARSAAGRVTSGAVGVLGGAGYMADSPVEKLYRDAYAYASLVGEAVDPFGDEEGMLRWT